MTIKAPGFVLRVDVKSRILEHEGQLISGTLTKA